MEIIMQESTFTKWILQIKPKHDENKRTSSHNQSQFRIKIPEKQIIYVCITGKNIVSILFNHFSAQLHKQNHSFCVFESVKLSVCSFPSNSRLWRLRWNPQLIFLNQLSIRESACKTTEEEEEEEKYIQKRNKIQIFLFNWMATVWTYTTDYVPELSLMIRNFSLMSCSQFAAQEVRFLF